MYINRTSRLPVELEAVKGIGTFQNHIYAVHSEDLIDASSETVLLNSTELDNGNDFSDVTDSDHSNDEPFCEGSVEIDNNQQCSSQSSMQKSSGLFLPHTVFN